MAGTSGEHFNVPAGAAEEEMPTDGTGNNDPTSIATALTSPGVVKLDPWLAPFKESLRHRYKKAQDWISIIDQTEGGLEKFSRVGPPY